MRRRQGEHDAGGDCEDDVLRLLPAPEYIEAYSKEDEKDSIKKRADPKRNQRRLAISV